MPSAVALFSGGLDSMLAVRLVQIQGFQVEALNVRTPFRCCQTDAAEAADRLKIPLRVVTVGDDYLDLVRHPMFGYGRGINPCVDCRIHMARLARQCMVELQADLVISGEVLGQRLMSQKRRDLDVVERHSGLQGRLLRPLSAKLLPPTLAEQQGLIRREALGAFAGSGRRKLIQLAARLGLPEPPTPSVGCILTQPAFAAKARDLLRWNPNPGRWHFDLLRHGRHIYLQSGAPGESPSNPAHVNKIVLGRNAEENAALRQFADRADAQPSHLLEPDNFQGPTALIVGPLTDEILREAGRQILVHTRRVDPENALARLRQGTTGRIVRLTPGDALANGTGHASQPSE